MRACPDSPRPPSPRRWRLAVPLTLLALVAVAGCDAKPKKHQQDDDSALAHAPQPAHVPEAIHPPLPMS